jgi:Flp pilus assembly protein TadB
MVRRRNVYKKSWLPEVPAICSCEKGANPMPSGYALFLIFVGAFTSAFLSVIGLFEAFNLALPWMGTGLSRLAPYQQRLMARPCAKNQYHLRVMLAPPALVGGGLGLVLFCLGTHAGTVLLGVVAGIYGHMVWQEQKRARAVALLESQLEDLLQIMIGCLRSGQSLAQALESAAGDMADPLASMVADAINNYRCGMTLTQSLKRALGKLAEHSFFRQFINTVELAATVGGRVTVTFLSLANAVHEHRLIQTELHARSTEARLSAGLLAIIPILLGVIVMEGYPQMITPLICDPFGRTAVMGAAILWVVGVVVSRRLIDFSTKTE